MLPADEYGVLQDTQETHGAKRYVSSMRISPLKLGKMGPHVPTNLTTSMKELNLNTGEPEQGKNGN